MLSLDGARTLAQESLSSHDVDKAFKPSIECCQQMATLNTVPPPLQLPRGSARLGKVLWVVSSCEPYTVKSVVTDAAKVDLSSI